MLIKILFIIIFLINLRYPIINLTDIIFIGFLILILFSTKINLNIKEFFYQKKFYILSIFFLTMLNFFLPKYHIQESHSIFVNEKDLKVIDDLIPNEIMSDIKLNYNNFDIQRMLDSYDGKYFNTKENFKNLQTIDNYFAFSSDSFFHDVKFSRKKTNIHFNSRETLRIGQLNTIKYNLVFDKEFRRILPYYVMFYIPSNFYKSKICYSGNLYLLSSSNELKLKEIKSSKFIKLKQKDCFNLDNKNLNYYLIGYSINENDNLNINLDKNKIINALDLFHYILVFLILFIFTFLISKVNFNINSIIYIISFISTFLFAFIRDNNLLFGLRYFRGGSDGLLHDSLAQSILENVKLNNFLMAIRGGEDTFYFMPGLRYFGSLSKMFFGDTNYAYLLLASFLPIALFIFLKNFLNRKYAIILIVSFIFLPIFENMGFGYFNYIWQVARNHAETLSITLIVISLSIIINFSKINLNKIDSLTIIFFLGFFLSFSAIARPNFFPTTSLLIFYSIITFYQEKKYIQILSLSFGYSFFLFCLIHNFYFGNSFTLFTEAKAHFAFNQLFLNLNFKNEIGNFWIIQFFKWNPIYNLHRLIFLIIIFFYIIFKKQNLLTYILFSAVVSQHILLIITHPDSRYAYLAWLLTFIVFIKIEYENKIFKSLFNVVKKFKIN